MVIRMTDMKKSEDKTECACKRKADENMPDDIKNSEAPDSIEALPLLKISSCRCES